MRPVLLTLGVLGLGGILLAGAIVFGGLYNVSARDGHWPGVSWVLHSAFESAVRLRAPAASAVPELSDARAALGAGHYDTACRFCHGAPGVSRSGTVQSMVPEPPPIAEAVSHFEPAELAWIVREGVKMTGMPGWASQRDDEVWSVVAFLVRVPDMTEADYQRLVQAPDNAEHPYCATCHGADGSSENPFIPRLDIQHAAYLEGALQLYRDGVRESGFMRHAATKVEAGELAHLAEHYAGISPSGTGWPVDPSLAGRGRELAFAESGDDDVPACRACHGPWPDRLDEEFPSLAGQSPDYLAAQLRLWRQAERGGGARHELMAESAANLLDEDIAALSAYYAGLTPARLEDVSDPQTSAEDRRQVAR